MDKKEIIRKFLAKGYQLTKEVLDKINPQELPDFFDFVVSNIKEGFITKEHLLRFQALKKKFKVIKKLEEQKAKSIEEFQEILLARYKKYKKLFANQFLIHSLISINKAKNAKSFSCLAMVVEKNNDFVLLEDDTASIQAKSKPIKNFDVLEVNDIAIFTIKQGTLEKINFLGIPNKKPKTTNLLLSVGQKNHFSIDFGNKYYFGENFLKIKNFLFFSLAGIKFLAVEQKIIDDFVKKWGKTPLETLKILLIKRHLNPRKICLKGDPFFIEEVPDIVILKSEKQEEPITVGGTTLFSYTKPFKINLLTREIIK